MNNIYPRRLIGCLAAAAVLALDAHADAVLDWNSALLSAARASRINPPAFTRAAVITHLAIYDTVNGIQRNFHPYHVTQLAPPNVSLEAAVAAAAHTATMALFTNVSIQQTNFTALYDAALAAIPDGPAKEAGLNWGQTVANAILALRATDGSAGVVAYTNEPVPGIWRPTPPANAGALLPAWGKVTPFCMASGAEFRPHLPPGLTTTAYALEYEITRLYGAKTNSLRSAEQTEIALFWSDGAGTETPPGHWNHIAQDVSRAQNLTIAENARLFALLNLAEADAAICCWDAKYSYNLWRPITAIREADTDGNPNTTADPTWEPLIATPPFPEFTSGHSTFSRAAATVLAYFFGRDDIAFSSRSDGLPGVIRHYPGFGAAADESGISRIYGGIHWESANIAGQTTGHLLGRAVTTYFLQPLSSPVFGLIKLAGQTAQITLQGEPNRPYRFQGSTNLKQWTDIARATADANGEVRVEDNTPEPYRFYRAIAE